jgi:hypothetical protein
VVALLLATAAQAQDAAAPGGNHRAMFYIAPYTGFAHLRIDRGQMFEQEDTVKVDALELGASLGFRTPFGLMLEIGRSDAVHANWFDDHGDIELTHSYASVGWRLSAGETWYFTPRIGRAHWVLESSHRWLFDPAGERHYEIDGWQNFWELGLTHDLNRHVSLGLNFKDVNQDFGHARSLTFVASFAF